MKLFLQTSAGTELALRCIEFDTYHVAIGSNCVEFDTRFNINKYIPYINQYAPCFGAETCGVYYREHLR